MTRNIALAVIIVTGLVGCMPMTVQHDYDPDVDFEDYRSFTWMPRSTAEGEAKQHLSGPFLNKRIRRAIVEALATQGISLDHDDPDFLIAHHLTYKQTSTTHLYQGSGYWGRHAVDINRYRESTLVVDFVDPDTQQLIWRGWAVSDLAHANSPQQEQENLRIAVREILKRFPPY